MKWIGIPVTAVTAMVAVLAAAMVCASTPALGGIGRLGSTRLAWAGAFAASIGAPSEAAIRFVLAWESVEGAAPQANNPLNSTLDEPGAHTMAGNAAGVKVYPSLAVGLDAALTTIEANGAYQPIMEALAQDAPQSAAERLEASPWCVGPAGGPCPGYGAAIVSLVAAYQNPATLLAAGRIPAGTTALGADPSLGDAVVAAAEDQLGVPYVFGAEADGAAFDCSGLVQWVYDQVGIALPRVAQAQFDAGPVVPEAAQLAPGDLVFFGSGPSAVSHVGLYVGDGQMIDAPKTGAVVRVEPISGFSPPYVGATHPAGDA